MVCCPMTRTQVVRQCSQYWDKNCFCHRNALSCKKRLKGKSPRIAAVWSTWYIILQVNKLRRSTILMHGKRSIICNLMMWLPETPPPQYSPFKWQYIQMLTPQWGWGATVDDNKKGLFNKNEGNSRSDTWVMPLLSQINACYSNNTTKANHSICWQ